MGLKAPIGPLFGHFWPTFPEFQPHFRDLAEILTFGPVRTPHFSDRFLHFSHFLALFRLTIGRLDQNLHLWTDSRPPTGLLNGI